jgi:Zn-finger nucleic acid-binding protein
MVSYKYTLSDENLAKFPQVSRNSRAPPAEAEAGTPYPPRLASCAILSEFASMPVCPVCRKELGTVPQRQGVFYRCSSCDGRALSIPQIRRVAGDHFAVRLLRLLKMRQEHSNSSCPFCAQRLLSLRVQEPPLELAGCRPCNIIWFDARNFALVPEWTVANNSGITMQDIETESLRRLKELKEREKAAAEEEKRKKSLHRSLKTLWDQKS